MKQLEYFSFVLAMVLACAVATSIGCVQIKGSGIDPHTGATNYFSGNFFFAKSAVEKLEIFRQTKTTSSMLSAKNASESGDVEMIKAISGAIGEAFAAGAKAAVKP